MLEALCGSKNVQKVLIFLFVNGKCYGSELHRALRTPLTPIQKALNRLEKGGLIISTYEGKTRLYQFNPAYPLITELETLLKKAYTLLPADQKKDYYVEKETQPVNTTKILFAFWDKLQKVTRLSFQSKSKSKEENGRNGRGQGEVLIDKEANQVIFNERGTWHGKQGDELTFSNIFRWTFDRDAGVISLEHLRRGKEHPVFLFHMAPTNKNTLLSVDSHLCADDVYIGRIYFDQQTLRFNWRIIGPHKNEEIIYIYS